MPTRLELLRSFVAQRPQDPFPHYALALELKGAGQLSEAWAEFESLLERHADYVPAYLHAGNTLRALGRTEDARQIYRRGLETSRRAGDAHAAGELQAALEEVG